LRFVYIFKNTTIFLRLSGELPSLEEVLSNSNIDIETLENQFTLLNSKYGKSKSIVTQGQLKSPDAKSPGKSGQPTDAIQQKKKKKNRKVKLPKNYNPAIPLDQERWIPLRERSYYKGKRNKKKNTIGKGTQGAVSGLVERSSLYNGYNGGNELID
jgi:signal recognition particle subunit SRP72